MNKIITIGREFGSGGRELGKCLAESLGVAYYDKEIITEIAKRTELSEQYVQSIVENRPVFSYPIQTGRSFNTIYYDVYSRHHTSIYVEQRNIIRELAEKSDCVIVGRCADYVLRDCSPYRIFVYADMKSKIERCRKNEHSDTELSDKELCRKITKIDRNRSKYYSFYTGRTWGDKLNYDLMLNTANCVISEVAPHIAKML